METQPRGRNVRFGSCELDDEASQLLIDGRPVRLPPQPYKLLWLLASQPGQLVTREQIRDALWPGDTFIDFEQGVNFAIKQVREALKDNADRPIYIQTVPKRGYRFIAPITAPQPVVRGRTGDLKLQKVLWSNIAELRMAEAARQQRARMLLRVAAIGGAVALVLAVLWVLRSVRL